MLTATKTANEKRKAFRAGLKSGKIQRFPGVFAPLVAMLAEELGFEGCYISGAVMSTFLGVPDIGLTTLTEVSEIGSGIARSTNLPSFIDADTGFGEPMSAARTIRVFEDLGLSGCHL
jgi:methylisocitrate lyase